MDSSSLPSLLVEAARAAAEEDGVASSEGSAGIEANSAGKTEEQKVELSADTDALSDGKDDQGDNVHPEKKEEEKIEQTEVAVAGGEDDQNSVNAVANKDSSSKKRPHSVVKEEIPQDESKTKVPLLRRGKWTPEEEAYASRLIVEFKAGILPITDGTTLRTFLSKILNCDPMRISKKFVGKNCVGKQVFRRKSIDISNITPEQIQRTGSDLRELEKRFLERIATGGNGRNVSAKSAKKKTKLSEAMPTSMGGVIAGIDPNRSAAVAAGHALLQGGGFGVAPGGTGNPGLLAQLQAGQPGMFNGTSGGLNIPNVGQSSAAPNSMNGSALDLNSLMLQTGMTLDQLAQLSQNKCLSSASLANMLNQKQSFDRLMSLDFKSMQSIDNLANLIQRGMSSQASINQMKNWDWNPSAQVGMQNTQGSHGTTLGNLSTNMLNLNPAQNTIVAPRLGNQNAVFGNILGNYNQSSFLQNFQQSHQNQAPQQGLNQISELQALAHTNIGGQNDGLGYLLQSMSGTNNGGNSLGSLVQSVSANTNNANRTFNSMMGIPGGNLPQQNLMGMNNSFIGVPFGGLSQVRGNPMMASVAPQHHLPNMGGGLNGVGGIDLSSVNLSDPSTAALVQQLLTQQGGGGGQLPAGIGGIGVHQTQTGAAGPELNNGVHQLKCNNESGPAADT